MNLAQKSSDDPNNPVRGGKRSGRKKSRSSRRK